MTKFIGFEVLTANALIHEMESSGKRYITLDYARKYAHQVSKNLAKTECLILFCMITIGFKIVSKILLQMLQREWLLSMMGFPTKI